MHSEKRTIFLPDFYDGSMGNCYLDVPLEVSEWVLAFLWMGYIGVITHLLTIILLGHPSICPPWNFFLTENGGPPGILEIPNLELSSIFRGELLWECIFMTYIWGVCLMDKLVGKYTIVPWILWNYEIHMDPMKSHGTYEIPMEPMKMEGERKRRKTHVIFSFRTNWRKPEDEFLWN